MATPFLWMLKPKVLELFLTGFSQTTYLIFQNILSALLQNVFKCTVSHHFRATKVIQDTSATCLVPFLHPYAAPWPILPESILNPAARMVLLKHESGCVIQALRVNAQIFQWLSKPYTSWPSPQTCSGFLYLLFPLPGLVLSLDSTFLNLRFLRVLFRYHLAIETFSINTFYCLKLHHPPQPLAISIPSPLFVFPLSTCHLLISLSSLKFVDEYSSFFSV